MVRETSNSDNQQTTPGSSSLVDLHSLLLLLAHMYAIRLKSDHQDPATDAESNDDLSVDSTIVVTTTPSDLHLDLIPIIEI